MAYERQSDSKVRGDSLDAFVSNLSATYKNQLTIRNAEDETNFNQLVLENNLSLDDQLDYRKDQLKRVSDDPTERKRVRGEISGIKDRIEQKKFSDKYLEKLVSYESGLSSIDTVLAFLQEQKNAATDQTIIDSINKEMANRSAEKFKLTSQLLSNQTEYAMKDKGDSVIDSQIARVNSAKTKALLAGDETTTSMLDLQLQGLTKAKVENGIEKDVKNFAVSSITGYATATKLLDAYNSKVSDSPSDVPIKIGDVTYSSAKEFWTYKRDSYVTDQSSSGFFTRLGDEVKTKINVANSKNALTANLLSDYSKEFSSLAGRPELAGFENKIETGKQDALQSGTNLITSTITDRYSVDYDINKAMSSLNDLKVLGVNVDSAYAKIITAGASIKKGQVDNILSAAQIALSNNPEMTPEQALNQAIATGAGTVLSPEELTKKSEKTITSEAAKTAGGETGVPDTRTTIGADGKAVAAPSVPTPPVGVAQPQVQVQNAEAGTKSITVKPGETLSAIALRELGSAAKFNEIAALNNITDPNKIQVGTVLKIPGVVVQPAAAPTTPTAPQAAAPTVAQPQPTPAPVAPTPKAPSAPYQGSSIVDYLGNVGQDSSFANRQKIAKEKGIVDYAGTADQNLKLLKTLRGF